MRVGGCGEGWRRTEDEVVELRVDVEGAEHAEGGDRVGRGHDAAKHEGLPGVRAVDGGDITALCQNIEAAADGDAANGGADESQDQNCDNVPEKVLVI